MKNLQLPYILALSCWSFAVPASQCSFNILSNEELVLQGKEEAVRTLSCTIDPTKESRYLLNMVSSDNSSMVNDFLVPEGSVVSMFFDPARDNNINLVLGANAKLNIMNDSLDTIHFECTQF